jgi:hypothetical protein
MSCSWIRHTYHLHKSRNANLIHFTSPLIGESSEFMEASSLSVLTTHIDSFIQLLSNERALMIVDVGNGKSSMYVERLADMDGATKRPGRGKPLNKERIGQGFIVAFDEQQHLLVVYTSIAVCKTFRRSQGSDASLQIHQHQLHLYKIDERSSSLQSFGSPFDLRPWLDPAVTICHASFVCGSEELLLIDSEAKARIFSFTTQMFRYSRCLDSVYCN